MSVQFKKFFFFFFKPRTFSRRVALFPLLLRLPLMTQSTRTCSPFGSDYLPRPCLQCLRMRSVADTAAPTDIVSTPSCLGFCHLYFPCQRLQSHCDTGSPEWRLNFVRLSFWRESFLLRGRARKGQKQKQKRKGGSRVRFIAFEWRLKYPS